MALPPEAIVRLNLGHLWLADMSLGIPVHGFLIKHPAGAGLVDVPVRPFRWIANVLGGLLFGFGMILAGGCSGSTWYRLGEGAVGAQVRLALTLVMGREPA